MNPARRRRRVALVLMLAVEPVVWFAGLVASVHSAFGGLSDSTAGVVFALLVLLAVAPPILVIVAAVRSPERGTVAIVLAAVALVVGVFFTIPEFAPRVMVETGDLIRTAQPPTAMESSASVDELESDARAELESIAALLQETDRMPLADSPATTEACTLRNDDEGLRFVIEESGNSSLGRQDTLDAVTERWVDLGYKTRGRWSDGIVYTVSDTPLDITVNWVDDDRLHPDPEHRNVIVSIRSLCVVA